MKMERPTTVRMSELYDFLKYQERNIVDIIKDTNSNCHEQWYIKVLYAYKTTLKIREFNIIDGIPLYSKISESTLKRKCREYRVNLEEILFKRRRHFLSEFIPVDDESDYRLHEILKHSVTLALDSGKLDKSRVGLIIKTYYELIDDPRTMSQLAHNIDLWFHKDEEVPKIEQTKIKIWYRGFDEEKSTKVYQALYSVLEDYAISIYDYIAPEINEDKERRIISISGEIIKNKIIFTITDKIILRDKSRLNVNAISRNRYINKEFNGDISDLREYLRIHSEYCGIELTSEYLNGGYYITLYGRKWKNEINTICSDTKGFLICDKDINVDFLYSLFDKNITYLFKRILDSTGYKPPFSPEKDKETGVYMSFEKEMIRNTCCKGIMIDGKKLRRDYVNSDDIINYAMLNKISVDFRSIEGNKKSENFDSIYVTIPIVSHGESRSVIIKVISKNKRSFDNAVLNAITSKPKYKKSNLNMSYFELSNMTLTTQNELVYVFDIKKGIRKALEE